MPFVHPYQKRKEFSFKECENLGLKKWQCPPFQFSIVAIILLIGVIIIASIFVLNIKTTLVILLVFAALMIMSSYLIVKNYSKHF